MDRFKIVFARPHVSNTLDFTIAHAQITRSITQRKSLDPNFDVMVLENLCFRSSTRIRQISIFKNLKSVERFQKPTYFWQ